MFVVKDPRCDLRKKINVQTCIMEEMHAIIREHIGEDHTEGKESPTMSD